MRGSYDNSEVAAVMIGWKIATTLYLILCFMEGLRLVSRSEKPTHPEVFFSIRFATILLLLYLGGFYK